MIETNNTPSIKSNNYENILNPEAVQIQIVLQKTSEDSFFKDNAQEELINKLKDLAKNPQNSNEQFEKIIDSFLKLNDDSKRKILTNNEIFNTLLNLEASSREAFFEAACLFQKSCGDEIINLFHTWIQDLCCEEQEDNFFQEFIKVSEQLRMAIFDVMTDENSNIYARSMIDMLDIGKNFSMNHKELIRCILFIACEFDEPEDQLDYIRHVTNEVNIESEKLCFSMIKLLVELHKMKKC